MKRNHLNREGRDREVEEVSKASSGEAPKDTESEGSETGEDPGTGLGPDDEDADQFPETEASRALDTCIEEVRRFLTDPGQYAGKAGLAEKGLVRYAMKFFIRGGKLWRTF